MGAPFPALDIPGNANWFYVSDSFTINNLGAPPTKIHQPGVANQDGLILPGQNLQVFIKSCSFECAPIMSDQNQGINVDVQLGIYDVVNLVGGQAAFKQVLPFVSPYGSAANGQLMNHVCKLSHLSPPSVRNFGDRTPMKLGLAQVPVSPANAQYQIGAQIQFNFGISGILVEYQYHIHGAWVAV